jgi:hypothetical protein
MKRIILVFILIYCQFSFSQEREASLIFYDNSKAKGLGEIKNNIIYFRLSETEKVETWKADIAKGLDFDGMGYSERYEYVKSDRYNKPILMEVIDEGFVILYRDVSVDYIPAIRISGTGVGVGAKMTEPENTYFVKRANEDKAYELAFSFKTRVKRILGDCKALMQKIDKREFTSRNIVEIVRFYNDYCGEDDEE